MAENSREKKLPGEPRTAREWLADYRWELEDPIEGDLRDLDMVMDHDEFWQWAGGKVNFNATNGKWELRPILIYISVLLAVVLIGLALHCDK
jgi:hypothetical protein